jgi:NlpC/P60 family
MRPFITHFVITTGILLTAAACNNSNKIKKRINANVVLSADSSNNIAKKPDTLKQYDSLQIEFGNTLSVPYDSIYNLKLYGFIKDNLGTKCFNNKKTNYTCESFLNVLFTEVYNIKLPGTPGEQMKYKNLELFKNTGYLKSGDILFFKNPANQPDNISHAGFYLYNNFFLVATYNEGIVLRKIDDDYWRKNFVAAGRINKLEMANN